MDADDEKQIPESVIDFENLVEDAYQQEISILTLRGETPPSTVSFLYMKPDQKNSTRPETTRMDVINAWRELLKQMKSHRVFTGYVTPMERAFLDIEDIPWDDYERLKTLVCLLTQTLQHHDQDESVEVRFVTLLEVLLSYADDWQASPTVTRMWSRIMHEIPNEIAPGSFRRRAYRVLMSLSWVPSTAGLLDACSYDEEKQKTNYSKAPDILQQEVFLKIRGGEPQPRYDSVNQLLDRLKDETDVCLAIWSEKEGMGKTTLAAQVASNASILAVFTVLWLRAGRTEHRGPLTYKKYIEYLDCLCEQLNTKQEWPEPVNRFEEPETRALREKSLMTKAREQLSIYIDEEGLNVLLILDDLDDSSWIEWFRFNEHQSIIVTTLSRDIEGVDWAVQLGAMSEEEAIELFLLEASLPPNHILGCTVELKDIVKMCDYNPLTVRSVARWFHLKQVTTGLSRGIEEVILDLESLDHTDRRGEEFESQDELDPNMFVFDVLSLMMGPIRRDTSTTSVLFVMCFAALVVVFPLRGVSAFKRRGVPLDAVLLLWEKVLGTEPHAIEEMCSYGILDSGSSLLKHAWFIAEGLIHLGVIQVFDDSVGDPWVKVHHKLYIEFANLMAREMDLKESFEQTLLDWNVMLVQTYFAKRIQATSTEKVDDNSMEYALRELPHHMLTGQMIPTTATILSEEHFFKARIEAIGWKQAVSLQLSDCIALQSSGSEGRASAPQVFRKIADMVEVLVETTFGPSEANAEYSRILLKVGFLLGSVGCYGDAINYFTQAFDLLDTSDPCFPSCVFGEAWCLLRSNDQESGLQKMKLCHEMMEQKDDLDPLYTDMLLSIALGLVATCQYNEAGQFYNVICEKLRTNPEEWQFELGYALHGHGRLAFIMGDLDTAQEMYLGSLKCKESVSETSRDGANVSAALGDVLMELSQSSKAKHFYETALDILHDVETVDEADYHLLCGKALFANGNHTGCSEEFDVFLEKIRESPVVLLDRTAYDMRYVARTYQIRGEEERARELLRESLLFTEDRPMSMERASGLSDLANSCIQAGETTEGLTLLEQAVEIQYQNVGESLVFVDGLKEIGNIHRKLEAFDEAMAVYYRVRDVLLRAHPDETDRMADILFAMGDALDGKDDTDDAIEAFKNCLGFVSANKAPDHPDVARALHRLGKIAQQRNDIEQAEEYFTKAYAIRQIDGSNPALAETSHSLGTLARRRGELDLAQEYFASALEIRRVHDNNEETAETLFEIGNVYRLLLEYESAVSVYEKGLEQLDDDSNLKVRIKYAHGQALVATGQIEEALDPLNKMLEFALDRYGRNDLRSGRISRSLGLLFFLLDDAERARFYLNEFVRLCETDDDEETCETMDYALTVFLLGEIYSHGGKMEQAEAVWIVSKEVCEDNGFEKSFADFFAIVKSRLESARPKGTGILAMLAGTDQIMNDPHERKTLQEIPFIDE